MLLPQNAFDAETVALMGRVCDEAWQEVQCVMFFPSRQDSDEVLRLLTSRVMSAVVAGERDPSRLRAIALEGVDGMINVPL
jgi:hypothetical protein